MEPHLVSKVSDSIHIELAMAFRLRIISTIILKQEYSW